MAAPRFRLLYELNTAHWLTALSRRHKRAVDLASVPDAHWAAIADLGCDAVWLMGVWQRSQAAAETVRTHPVFAHDRAFPGQEAGDLLGSPFAVGSWRVESRFGGEAALASARAAAARHGLGLVLDWIPNHVGPDHPWALEHPEWFVRGSAEELAHDRDAWRRVGGAVLACGRDPYFPAWPDTVQVDANHPDLRAAAAAELQRLAGLCDGVRCDLAMLMLPDVVASTWGGRCSQPRPPGYWPAVLAPLRAGRERLVLLGECYWERERDLLAAGLDACYDKGLYDAMRHGDAAAVRARLAAFPGERAVRFLENHDEPRAATAFAKDRLAAAAVAVATLPGTWLFHAGQEHGHQVRAPVTIGRGADEGEDQAQRAAWRRLGRLRRLPAMTGSWSMLPTSGWADNQTHRHLLAWAWESPSQRLLTVVNWSPQRSQARVRLPWPGLDGHTVRLRDPLQDGVLERDGDELAREGLYVDLAPWSWHVLVH